jgi:hypothetical protein
VAGLLAGRGSDQSGALVVSFHGAVLPLAGKVTIRNAKTGGTFDLRLQGGLRFDTENALQAPWVLPDADSKGTITLFNASTENILVKALVIGSGANQPNREIGLGPHQTKQIPLRDLLAKEDNGATQVGSVLLRYSGPAHALQPALLIENAKTGFALAPQFNASHAQLGSGTTTWVFPSIGVRVGGSTTQFEQNRLSQFAVISNGTEVPQTPQIAASFVDVQHHKVDKAILPIAPLGPFETRMVNLSQFIDMGLIPASAPRFALSVTYNGVPGDMGFNIFTADLSNNRVTPVEGTVLPKGTVEFSYFDLSSKFGILPKVENSSSSEALAQVSLFFPGSFGVGSFNLPSLQIEGNGSKIIDLQGALHSGIPDPSGHSVASGTTFGILALAANDQKATPVIMTPECDGQCEPVMAATVTMVNQKDSESSVHLAAQSAAPLAASCPQPPTCPSEIVVESSNQISLSSQFASGLRTGVGRVVAMQTRPTSTNWNGTLIVEAVSNASSSCPASFGDQCAGSDTFTVGDGGVAFGQNFPARTNIFYDQHVTTDVVSLLDTAGINSCTAVCSQQYSCGGTVIGRFTITRRFAKSSISSTPVTIVNVSKVRQ